MNNDLNKVQRAMFRLKVIRRLLLDILNDNLMYDYEYENLLNKLNGFEFLLLVDFGFFHRSGGNVEDFNRRFMIDE